MLSDTQLNISTSGRDTKGERSSASLQWDGEKGKWFWEGGGIGDVDVTDEITEVNIIDKIRIDALANFITSEIGENAQLANQYEAAGTFRLISGMNNVSSNVSDLDKALQPIVEEYKTLKSDIDSGKVIVGFVENTSGTTDVSVAFNIQYYIR